MKTQITLILILIVFISKFLFAQSIVIGTGASMVIPSGADICAGSYGNISGDISGNGTQCTQTPVPVELTTFIVKVSENNVLLEWITETEVNNYGFEIERNISDDWKKIGFVEGHGNSNSPKNYSFADKNLFGGSKFQYRLKQVDTDGHFEYSDIVEVEFLPDRFDLSQNYPNPFNPTTKIRYQLPEESKVIIKIYDLLGTEVVTLVNEKKEPGIYDVELNAQSLSSGTYIYRMVTEKHIEAKKMTLLK